MSNPVFSKMERDWSRADSTPAGYPTMPGYQPTNAQPSGTAVLDPQRYPYAQQQASAQTSAQNPYGAPSGAPAVDPSAYADMQAAYQAPSADAVDRGRMTYDDALIKTGITFL
ncbi:MAG: Bax1 inhibitor-like family protein, partial [Trueperella pyogenes]|nr:Bax1 inhibitor-like family protein [Trueperella pyogenes]